MRVCVPVEENNALESEVYGHFGSAPAFMLFNAESESISWVENINKKHEHGKCNPLESFGNEVPEIVIVKGIGGGALGKLLAAGVKVYQAEADTLKENIDILTTKGLRNFNPDGTCGSHAHKHEMSGGCGHHHHHDHSKGCNHHHGEGGSCCH